MKIIMDPKPDITAFELAVILVAQGTAVTHENFRYIIEVKCPKALRHFPGLSKVR